MCIATAVMAYSKWSDRKHLKRLQDMIDANDEIHRIHRDHLVRAIEYAQCAHETGDHMFWIYSAEEFKKAEEVLG